MADFVKVASTSEVLTGSMKTFTVKGIPVALANVDGQFFAVSDICTHEHCSLGTEGFLNDNIITCGCHGAQFDLTTGRVLALPAPGDVASYEVKVEGNDVFVKI